MFLFHKTSTLTFILTDDENEAQSVIITKQLALILCIYLFISDYKRAPTTKRLRSLLNIKKNYRTEAGLIFFSIFKSVLKRLVVGTI